MPPLPHPAYRLDLWSAPAPAGGTRTAFLVEPGTARGGVRHVRRTRFLEQGQSRLTFEISPTHHALATLAPQQAVVRLTRFVPTTPDTFDAVWEEWRVLQRRRPVRRIAAPYEIACVPLEDDLLDAHLHRVVGAGGLSSFRYGATDRTPADVLADVAASLVAVGHTWVSVGAVSPTTPVTFALEGVATPRTIITALLDALAAKGVTAEFEWVRAGDGLSYQLTLVDRIGGALTPLIATTDAAAVELVLDEDASEQVNVVIPFAEDGTDLRDLQVEIQAVDGGTGWVTLRAIGATPALVVGMDDQWNGRRLFRELTGRSFAILDSSASPMRVQLATADLASGLAAGERVSFREVEDFAGSRRAFATKSVWSPLRVVSSLTGPPRINTEDLNGAGATIHAANQYRDWEVQRSTLVAALPNGDFNHVAGTWTFASAPSAAPAIGDWIWCPAGAAFVPGTVLNWNGGTNVATVEPRYAGQQFTTSQLAIVGARCYRPAGSPMWIQASATSGGQLTVDAFSGGTPSAGDVLELLQRHQGVRLVEVRDPVAVTETRRRVGTLQLACTGATNRIANADLAAWAGASGDPPDGWTIVSVVGTVTRSRTTDPLETRHGGKAWKFVCAVGSSFEVRSPLIPVHGVPGLQQVAASWALLFQAFTGGVPLEVSVVAVDADGTRTTLGEPFRIFPPDTAATADDNQKAALDTWYDAVLTNLSIATIAEETLQLVLVRAAGASNPACTFVLDAAMLLHREGLPEASEGGVRYVFGSDATPLLSAAQELLADRARPLLRVEGRLLDLYRLDGLRYAPFELTPGRDVALSVPALALTRTVRLLGVTEDVDDATACQVVLDRVRPDVARLLATQFATPVLLPAETPSSGGLPYANVSLARTAYSATQITLVATSTCPGRTPPQVRVTSLSGGISIASGPSVGTPAGSGQAWVINRNPNGSGSGLVVVETVGSGLVHDIALATIEEQGVELVPLVVRARVIASDATTLTVRVAVADPLPQGTDSATITVQHLGTGGVAPSTPQTVTPAATLTEGANTYKDYVITKPAPTDAAPVGRVTFTVTAANRLSASDAQEVPPKIYVPAWLDIEETKGATEYEYAWDGGPAPISVTIIVGASTTAESPPSSNPVVVSRHATLDTEVTFVAVGGAGDTRTQTFIVPPLPAPTPSLSTLTVTRLSGTDFEVDFTPADMPSGAVYRIEWLITADGSGSGTVASATPPETIAATLGSAPSCDVLVTAETSTGEFITSRRKVGPMLL